MYLSLVNQSRFMYIIRSDAGQPLRDELAKSPQKILANAFPEFSANYDGVMASGSATPPTSLLGDEGLAKPPPDSLIPPSAQLGATSDAYFRGLALVKTLVKLIPGWLQSNRNVFETLVVAWKSNARLSRLQNEQELDLVQVSFTPCAFPFIGCPLKLETGEENPLLFLLYNGVTFGFRVIYVAVCGVLYVI